MAKDFNSPVEVYEYARFLNGRLIFSQMETEGCQAPVHSLFETDGNLTVSAVKQAEDGSGIVLRLYNGQHRKAAGDRIRFSRPPRRVQELNLMEEPVRQLQLENGELRIDPIGHCRFLTLRIDY